MQDDTDLEEVGDAATREYYRACRRCFEAMERVTHDYCQENEAAEATWKAKENARRGQFTGDEPWRTYSKEVERLRENAFRRKKALYDACAVFACDPAAAGGGL